MSIKRIHLHCRRTSPYAGRFAVTLLLALTCCQVAGAVDYTWENVDAAYVDQRAVATQKVLKDQVMMGRSSLSNNRVAVENWYRKYLFPAIASQDRLGDLYANRESLMKDLEAAGRTDQTNHQFLVDLAYTEAAKRATGNYHPTVRFNAMLIIGSLNQMESRMTERLPEIRLPRAFDFMVDELKKPDQIDAVRLAAMIGIERHLRLVRQRPQDQPIPDGRKAEVADLMKTLVEQQTPPAARTLDGHTWMRRGAIDVLAALGQVGDAQSIFNSLVNIVNDSSEPLSLRCTAARALNDLDYTGVSGIDALATAQKLGSLAAFACRNEDSRVKDAQKELEEEKRRGRMGGMGGYPGMGMEGGYADAGMGGGGGYAEMGMGGGYPGMGYPGAGPARRMQSQELDDLQDDARRLLKLPIHCVLLGIRGEPGKSTAAGASPGFGSFAQLAADDTQKAEIQKIVDALDDLIVATDAIDEGINEMMEQVRTKTRALETLLPTGAVTEDPALESDLPGGDRPGGEEAAAKPAEKS